MATLENKTIVVVGGTSGIGFAVALAALQSQAKLVIVASSNPTRVERAIERLRSHKLTGEVRGEVLDAKDTAAVKEFAVSLGTVDHVAWTSGDVEWAGGEADANAPKKDPLASALATRFWGPFNFAQSVKFAPGGSLTITTGMSSNEPSSSRSVPLNRTQRTADIRPRPGLTVAAGAAAAIEGLTKSLAVDLAPVRVNVVSPGAINTELWDQFPPQVQRSFQEGITDILLIKRIGEPEDVAEVYLFLMKCGYITGQRINVDGGIQLG